MQTMLDEILRIFTRFALKIGVSVFVLWLIAQVLQHK